jgi:hypothetical protein
MQDASGSAYIENATLVITPAYFKLKVYPI